MRTDKARFWWFVKQRDVFDAVSVRIGEVKLRRRHPTDNRWFGCNLPRKIPRDDTEGAEAWTGRKQLGQRNRDGKVTRVRLSSRCAWTPQTKNCTFVGTNHKENN